MSSSPNLCFPGILPGHSKSVNRLALLLPRSDVTYVQPRSRQRHSVEVLYVTKVSNALKPLTFKNRYLTVFQLQAQQVICRVTSAVRLAVYTEKRQRCTEPTCAALAGEKLSVL